MNLRNTVHHGDALARLRELPNDCVQCVVTSPPFYRLRRFGATEWLGGEGQCDHAAVDDFCSTCGAWHGELGWEPTVDLYIQHLVQIFREVRRVLREDGVCWIEIDDSYAGSGRGPTGKTGIGDQTRRQGFRSTPVTAPEVPAKNMLLIPEAFALALQRDGWIFRRRIIWVKTAPLPESARSRPAHSHSNIFMLSKRADYMFDFIPIMEPARAIARGRTTNGKVSLGQDCVRWNPSFSRATEAAVSLRNCRDVWVLPPGHYKGAHTATFPPPLPERCIRASTSDKGSCARCGAPIRRQVERGGLPLRDWVTIGWRATCKCGVHATVPSVVLDPFAGTGTTLQVARWLGRDYLGIEANARFIDLIHERLRRADQRVVELEAFRRMTAGFGSGTTAPSRSADRPGEQTTDVRHPPTDTSPATPFDGDETGSLEQGKVVRDRR